MFLSRLSSILAATAVAGFFLLWPDFSVRAEEIQVVLSTSSSAPYPRWQLKDGPEYQKVLELFRVLKVTNEPLFDYEEWNRPGYSSFWIYVSEGEGEPYRVHLWRDRAYVPEEGGGRYAIGARRLYDVLVHQAEARGLGAFFVHYRDK